MKIQDLELPPTNLGRIRQLTDELHDDQTTLYLFFKLSPDLFCVANHTGYFEKVNQAWTMILGWTEEDCCLFLS